DGQLIHDFEDKPLSALYAVASRNERTREVILKVVNVSDRAVETEVRLQGGRRVQPAGRAITLTGNSLDEENSFEQPKRIAPVERTLREVAPRFRYTFPKHSLTVLVLKEGR
ncbi:MAG: alpha-N-arabinofuranosidase, partial [Armatimonadetes bacterium]|nr:alpha-N-arabinofuranosidase [Armatimonadota bacterium]